VSLGTPPQAIAIDPRSDRIYIANQRTASLTVIDGKTNVPAATVKVGAIPYALEVDASAHLLYVANFSSNDVTVVGK
jgi:YVTN family beta-propeller protein